MSSRSSWVDQPAGNQFSRRGALKAGLSLGALGVLGPLLEACSGGATATANGGGSRGNELVGSLAESFVQFDPRTNSALAGICVTDLVFEGLLRRDPTSGQIVPQLANAMPTKVGSNTYRVGIRPGAKFSNGTPVTAEDVIYTLKTMQSSKLASLYEPYLDIFADARKIDSHTVEFVLSFPTTLVNDRLAFLKVVPKAYVESKGDKAFAVHPVGSGPYKFVSAVSNGQVTLARNAVYNGNLANSTPTVIFRQQTDDSSRVSGLLSGQNAAIDNVPFHDIATLKQRSNLQVNSVQGNLNALILFNCGKPPFKDVRVRQAFLYALNRDRIVQGAYLGNARVANNILTPSDPGYVQPSTSYNHDPAKAKSLLSAAGYPHGFNLELMVANQGIMTAAAPLIQSDLNAAGIKTTLKEGDTEALYSNVTNGHYQAYFTPGDWSVFGRDPDLMLSWLYQGAFASQYLFWTTSDAKRVSKALDAGLRAADPAQAQSQWAQAQNIIVDSVPAFPLFQLNAVTAHSREITGFTPPSEAGLYFENTTAGNWHAT
jgi:peptide/nickel transport system substrate-binding protein